MLPATDWNAFHNALLNTHARNSAFRRAARRYRERNSGYHTLSAVNFEKDHLPPEFAKRLPHYPSPAAVIVRLTVDLCSQGNGLGEVLLPGHASAFYEKYRFVSLPSHPLRLSLPL